MHARVAAKRASEQKASDERALEEATRPVEKRAEPAPETPQAAQPAADRRRAR